MKIFVLTSSRADYGIYLPLLNKLKVHPTFELKIVAFGTHLSPKFGMTVENILNDGLNVDYRIETIPKDDSPSAISESIAETVKKFTTLWTVAEKKDLIICLGDRYEMFAAVVASVPFQIPIAHLHGGETTLGAIDEVFRTSLSAISSLHFASTQNHADRVAQIRNDKRHVYNVGALGLDNINELEPYSIEEFQKKFNILLDKPILVTFHPETVNYERNDDYARELCETLLQLDQQIIITMPNADTNGDVLRKHFAELVNKKRNVFIVESLGTKGYFTCMKNCDFLLGNSSSGIIEAASFGKFVLNLGKRQKGRECSENVIHCDIKKEQILLAVKKVKEFSKFSGKNIYGDGNTAARVIDILEKHRNEKINYSD